MIYKYKKRKIIISTINIVPFTDVVLVLLIVFILITPVFTDNKYDIKINLPKVDKNIVEKEKNVSAEILISSDDCIYINGVKMNSFHDIDLEISKFVKLNIDYITINADKNVSYNTVIQIMNKVRNFGITKFGFAVNVLK
jgi:biopolymer transport protein ExbD